jgi:hypothetical protein
MNIAFCIGNGPSRKNFDINKLKVVGPTYGCNHLVETFPVDNTIVVDKNTLIDLIARGYNKKTNVYTRRVWHNLVQADNLYFLNDPIKNPIEIWDREIQWGSGVHALNLAASLGADIIIMLGYDLYNSNFDPKCWIYQINKCFELHPQTQFVQIQNDKWQPPEIWTADNFLIDTYKGLVQLLKDNQLT